MGVLDQLNQEAPVIVGDDVLGEALVLLVDGVVVLPLLVDRSQEASDLAACDVIDVRAGIRLRIPYVSQSLRPGLCYVGRRHGPP